MIVGRRNKETADIIRHTIDFTDWLDSGETIDTVINNAVTLGTTGWSTSPFPVQSPYDPSPLAIRSTTVVGSSKEVQVFLTSGTPGNVYTMQLKVLGTSGREKVVELEVQITGTPPVQPVVAQPGANFNALSVTGGNMLGPLYLFEDPLTDMEAADKRYVDNLFLTTERDLASEAAARIAEDNVLQAEITAEISRAETAESTLTTNLAAEVTRAEAAEATNAAAIASEATTRAAADSTLTTNLAAEITRAEAAEALKATITSLNTEIARAEAAEATNAAAIAAEITRAEAAEGTGASASGLAAEITRAEAAEATIAANLAAEIARAEAAEAALSGSTTSAGVRAGTATTDGSGVLTVTYSPAFANDTVHVAVGGNSGFFGIGGGFFAPNLTLNTTFTSANGFTAFLFEPDPATGTFAIAVPGTTVKWYAIGY